MLTSSALVVLLDIDNTLLDNDRFVMDLDAHLEQTFGAAQRDRYWNLYSKLRNELGYADYLGALQLFRVGLEDDPNLLQMSAFLLEYPFAQCVFPRAFDVIAHLGTLGLPVVLSDGDMVFQPRKVQRSGIWDAVSGRVLITLHKEHTLDAMQRHYPAQHYVMVDDKPQLLAAMKRIMTTKLTTVFVQQGHYAREAIDAPINPRPDLSIADIGELLDRDLHADALRRAGEN